MDIKFQTFKKHKITAIGCMCLHQTEDEELRVIMERNKRGKIV
jgi:hypothetical protein